MNAFSTCNQKKLPILIFSSNSRKKNKKMINNLKYTAQQKHYKQSQNVH